MALDIWPIEASMTTPLSHGVDYLWNELKAHTKLVRAETYSVHEISWLVGVHATDRELFRPSLPALLSANNTRRVNCLRLDLSIFIGINRETDWEKEQLEFELWLSSPSFFNPQTHPFFQKKKKKKKKKPITKIWKIDNNSFSQSTTNRALKVTWKKNMCSKMNLKRNFHNFSQISLKVKWDRSNFGHRN